jgi:hypothetical protein
MKISTVIDNMSDTIVTAVCLLVHFGQYRQKESNETDPVH